MKARDLIQLLEYGKAFPSKPDRTNRKKEDDFPLPNIDEIIATIDKKKRDVKLLEDWVKGQEKLNKPEEKKEKTGWDAMSFVRKVTILTVTVPLASMGYALVVLAVFNIGAMMLGYHK